MQPKSKASKYSTSKEFTKIGLNSTSTSIHSKSPEQSSCKKPFLKKTSSSANQKENIKGNTQISPPETIKKGVTFKPKIKCTEKIDLSENSFSIFIKSSETKTDQSDLLDTLLYGENDVTYSSDFCANDNDNDELLLDNCEDFHTKVWKNLSPIKSIPEVNEHEERNSGFFIEKCLNRIGNILMSAKKENENGSQFHSVLLRRIIINFSSKEKNILDFFFSIENALTKEELTYQIRNFLFKNSIIFNRNELNELIEGIENVLHHSMKKNKTFNEFVSSNYYEMMEEIFFKIADKNIEEIICVDEETQEKIFEYSNRVSVWSLLSQMKSNVPKLEESEFRQSRFCISDKHETMDDIHEKRKEEMFIKIGKWLGKYLRETEGILNCSDDQNSNMIIKISPPCF